MSQDSDSDQETAAPSSPRWRSGVRTRGQECLSVDPHEAYLAGVTLGPVMRNYRSARVRRAKRKAQRRQMLALMVPVLAFAAAFFGKGFFSSGMQELADLGGKAIAAAGRGDVGDAIAALYDAVRLFGASITVKKLLLPIFLTVVLRMARAKIMDKINNREADSNQQEETGDAAATHADAVPGINLEALEETKRDEVTLALSYEWPRRMQHAISGFVILGLYLTLPFYLAFACVLIAIIFLHSVRLVRWLSPRVNGVYVQLLSGIIRPVEKNPSNHPAALPFLWACLFVLTFSNSRSLAVLCVLLLSIGDPAAGVGRRKCMRSAAAAAAAAAANELTDGTAKADCGEKKKNAAAGAPQGCCCSSSCCSSNCSMSSSDVVSKRCYWGFSCCTVACAVSVVLLALCLACIFRGSSPIGMQKYENPGLRAALNASGLAYPWPSVRPLADADAAGAASVAVGFGLLEGDLSSWLLLCGMGLVLGVIASLGEIINVGGFDDNLTMPIFCMVCFAGIFGVYVHLKGLAGSFVGPVELRAMNRFDQLMLLLFAL